MNEKFDPNDIQAVSDALRGFLRRCDQVLALLEGKRYLKPHERGEVTTIYASLKAELGAAAKNGTLSGRREPRTRVEECFYDSTVRKAHIALRPATNSNPISSRWYSAVYDAQLELSYKLHDLARLQSDQA